LIKYVLPAKVRANTAKEINTIEKERGRNGEEEGCRKKFV